MLATRGCLPFKRVEGNTQSPACECVVFCFQASMNSASNGWSGTGPFDALLFGKPTRPHVQVRRTWIIPSAKLTSCHCKPKHSDIRSPVPAAKSVRVRSGSQRLHTIAYACSGVRIIASYPVVVLQRTRRMGFDSWSRGIRPYRWPCLYTKDITRRVLSSVGLARSSTRVLDHRRAVWSRQPSRDGTALAATRRRRGVPQAVRDVRGTGVPRPEKQS